MTTPSLDRPSVSRAPRLLAWAHLAVLLGFYLLAAVTYGDAPAQIPVHFDITGDPDRWAATTFWTWFGLPLVATGLFALGTGVSVLVDWLVRKHPQWVNIPSKEKFLKLDEAGRLWVIAPLEVFLRVIFIGQTLLFAQIFAGTVQVGTSGGTLPLPFGAIVFVFLVIGGIIGMIVAIHRRIAVASAVTRPAG